MGERFKPTPRRALFEIGWQFERSFPKLFEPGEEFPPLAGSKAGKASDRQELLNGSGETRFRIVNRSAARQQELQLGLGEIRLSRPNAERVQERPGCPMTTQDDSRWIALA